MFQHQERKASFSLSPDCSLLLKALRRSPQTVAFLKGHQRPWFAKFFTNKLDKGGQIKKCKQELNVPFASQLGESLGTKFIHSLIQTHRTGELEQ